jgi:hypothetical protein
MQPKIVTKQANPMPKKHRFCCYTLRAQHPKWQMNNPQTRQRFWQSFEFHSYPYFPWGKCSDNHYADSKQT